MLRRALLYTAHFCLLPFALRERREVERDPPALAAVREGAPLVLSCLGTGLGLLLCSRSKGARAAGGGMLALAGALAWFFRDPVRRCPAQPGVLYAPADGVVQAVDEVEWDWFIHGRALRVVVFLSPLNVHVNRSPAAGRLVAYRREPGGAAPACLVGGSQRNARQLLAFRLDPSAASPVDNRVVVAQMVGFLVRRIVSWRFPGDAVAAGEKIGMIRFGSRTDLLVPAGLAEPLVSPGDVVYAGVTPVARYTASVRSPKPEVRSLDSSTDSGLRTLDPGLD